MAITNLELAAKAEQNVRQAIKYLKEMDNKSATKYVRQLEKILIDNKGKSGLESLVRKLGGI